MAFTYELATPIGQVRLMIPDNNAEAFDLSDAEIEYFLSLRGNNVKAAAVEACSHLARKYAKLPTFSADGLSVNNGQRAQTFAERAKELKAELGGGLSSVSMLKIDAFNTEESEYVGAY
jgi:hypothetical protein